MNPIKILEEFQTMLGRNSKVKVRQKKLVKILEGGGLKPEASAAAEKKY